MSLTNLDSKNYPDIESGEYDTDYYVELIEEHTTVKQAPQKSTWRIGSLLAAFLSLLCFTGTNYVAGTQKGDIYAGKVANSLFLGMFAFVYITYMVYTKDENFSKTWNVITKYFGKISTNPQEYEHGNDEGEETLKAISLSLLWGFINAIANTSLYVAFMSAQASNLNISVCTAIISGYWIFALVASFFVFEDKITLFQTLGVFVNMGGVLLISIGQGVGSVTPTMIIGSWIATTLFGIRVILSRYCTNRLNSIVFMNINFVAEFIFGVIWILIALWGWFKFDFDFTSELIMFAGGAFSAGAEIFLFIGIERGIAGAVVSIAGSNSIFVGLLNWIFQGSKPTSTHIIAIGLTTSGILVMSLGDMVYRRVKKRLT